MRDILSLLTTVASDDIQWHFDKNVFLRVITFEETVMHKQPLFVFANV